MKNISIVVTVLLFLISCSQQKQQEQLSQQGPYFGNGVHNGWVDQNSITIWTRLTQSPEMNWEGQVFIPLTKEEQKEFGEMKDKDFLNKKQILEGLSLKDMEGACLGSEGEVQLTYYEENKPETKVRLDWTKVEADKNFTKQWKLKELSPDARYVIEMFSRMGEGQNIADTIIGGFTTPPLVDKAKDIAFSIVSCHDYIRKDSTTGHKIYPAMDRDNLDFFVHTGDIEYYDKPNPYAMTEELMRFKWDRLFALPLQRSFYNRTSSYFMKDDHDALKNDAYPDEFYGPVSFERGLEIFDKEQFPSNSPTYKTVRWGKDLQIWILEGRNYRSKNTDEDGSNKTILGKEQKEWLFSTIDESDATYKVVITSSPILGPDRPQGKNDNYSNEAFAYEGNEIREFINKHDNVIVCTGDRHWQYVSHFKDTNLWEFGCGAGSDSHAGGWSQDNVKPEHRFLRVKGGYLFGKVYSDGDEVKLIFEHRDVDGNVMHKEEFVR
ncbi:alkaline phosphatase D family protein [Reichenbachiella sp. MALMAid0571]|uniref:alkaline phosphatase D family protein n=1 Tax=Reichenbachiella sp. MALMAid0571 TaxID=3143939 RepID=UPI0032DF2F53